MADIPLTPKSHSLISPWEFTRILDGLISKARDRQREGEGRRGKEREGEGRRGKERKGEGKERKGEGRRIDVGGERHMEQEDKNDKIKYLNIILISENTKDEKWFSPLCIILTVSFKYMSPFSI